MGNLNPPHTSDNLILHELFHAAEEDHSHP